VVRGPLWGGNLEIIDWNLRAGRWIQPNAAYAGSVLLLETSEELPDALYVYRVLMAMGERGLLQQFAGVLVARPKASFGRTPRSAPERVAYRDAQREAIVRALEEYAPGVPAVFGVDAGHTDPMVVLPIGGPVTLDPAGERITVEY
jgi:muramoyltetrapeptide carboxypeptidase LdcA involved in peptidoglycan recycling